MFNDLLKNLLNKHLSKLIFLIVFIAFLASKYVLNLNASILSQLGMAAFLSILYLAYDEFSVPESEKQKSKKTLKENLIEAGIAVIAALVLYGALGFILHTPTPINVITSCSMLPAYDRGDLIILSGDEPKAPLIKVPANSQFSFATSPCTRIYNNGSEANGVCTSSLNFQNLPAIPVNKSNDLIVYDSQSPIGLIVHRVMAKVQADDGSIFYITKGDNNYQSDQEFGIPPIPKDKVNGKVIARIPFIGYVKLFLFLQFQEPPYCDSHFKN